MKASFEDKEDVSGIYVFTGYLSVVNNLQVGIQGPIPTKYKRSLEDIQSISCELLFKLKEEA